MNRSGLASLLVLLVTLAACAGAPTDYERLVAARTALEQGRVEEARATADAVHAKSPEDPEAKRILAAAHREMGARSEEAGALEEAHGHFVRAGELELRRETRAQDWYSAWRNGRDAGLEDAQLVEHLVASLEADPTNLEVRRAAATTYDELEQPAAAVVHYLWVWEADRADIPVGLRLGSLYFALGELDDAYAIFRRILEREPANVQAQLRIADIFEAKGRAGRVHEVYRQLQKDNPGNAMILFRYADFLERSGRSSEAEKVRAQGRGELPGVERREMRELKRRK